jgi:hypothetical protein
LMHSGARPRRPPVALADLIQTLRTDLADPQGGLFSDEALGRCLLRSVFALSRDLGQPFTVQGSEIVPEPRDEALELLLLLGRIAACQTMRSATANAFSFSSGDKRVDKTGQSTNWAKLEEDLLGEYRQRLAAVRPDAAAAENYVITPDLRPVICEQGKWRHHRRHHDAHCD